METKRTYKVKVFSGSIPEVEHELAVWYTRHDGSDLPVDSEESRQRWFRSRGYFIYRNRDGQLEVKQSPPVVTMTEDGPLVTIVVRALVAEMIMEPSVHEEI